jgi:Pyridoxamine 5'-phosphate oxidase
MDNPTADPSAGASAVDPRAVALLVQPLLGLLAFNGLEGRPRVLPVWFLYEDGDILIGSPRHAYKNRCLSADPRASFAVVSSTRPHQQVTLLADAVVQNVSDDDRNQFIKRTSTHYLGREGSDLYLENWHSRRQPNDGGRIRLRPIRVRFTVSGGSAPESHAHQAPNHRL